jgi:hypothetical protein
MRRMLYLGLAEVAAGLLEGFAEMSAGGDQA